MNADGSGQTNLTNSAVHESRPDWQPIPINAYPRPKGASPMRDLTRAGLPALHLAQPHPRPAARVRLLQRRPSAPRPSSRSAPPTQTARAPRARSIVQIGVLVGNPATPADEADLRLFGTHQRRPPGLGPLRLHGHARRRASALRITDTRQHAPPRRTGRRHRRRTSPYSFPIPCLGHRRHHDRRRAAQLRDHRSRRSCPGVASKEESSARRAGCSSRLHIWTSRELAAAAAPTRHRQYMSREGIARRGRSSRSVTARTGPAFRTL